MVQVQRLIVAGVAALLSGCAAASGSDPVGWWHQFRGGRIAEERPAVPGAEAAWPNLASVPARPQADDTVARGRITVGLVADRANAQYATGSTLPPVPIVAPRPVPPSAGMNASLDAASKPETPSTAAPRRAPAGKVESAPLAAPAVAASDNAAPLAPIPDAPPAPPNIAGVRQATLSAPPPLAPPPAAVAIVLPPGAPVAVAFDAGGSLLQDAYRVPLRALAGQRAGRGIAVVGYGEAPESDPAAQARALPLAWERAGAIARALASIGVPEAAITVSASAVGRGGVARLAE